LFRNCCNETCLLSSVMMIFCPLLWHAPFLPYLIADSMQLLYNLLPSGLVHHSSNVILCFFSLFTVVSISSNKIWCSSSSLGSGMIRLSSVTTDRLLSLSVYRLLQYFVNLLLLLFHLHANYGPTKCLFPDTFCRPTLLFSILFTITLCNIFLFRLLRPFALFLMVG